MERWRLKPVTSSGVLLEMLQVAQRYLFPQQEGTSRREETSAAAGLDTLTDESLTDEIRIRLYLEARHVHRRDDRLSARDASGCPDRRQDALA